MLYDDVWEPGRPLAADYRRRHGLPGPSSVQRALEALRKDELVARTACPHGHAAPLLACACGIYAARRPEDALVYLTGRDEPGVVGRVLGRVALWGLVVEAEHGWRAEHAYPFELASAEAAQRYGVRRCREIPRSTSSARRSPSAIGRSSARSTRASSSSAA